MKEALLGTIFRFVTPFFRRRRMRWFYLRMRPEPGTRVLDVGGYPYTWRHSEVPLDVTTLNLDQVPDEPCARAVVGDACNLAYPDQSFNIVFSNSVIEHVGTFERQSAFAKECRRVGKNLWIQTPAREFVIEPHLVTPFIHFAPVTWQRKLLRNFTVWGWLKRPTTAEVDGFLSEVRLISRQEMQLLFPDCLIKTERFLGLPKSYIAIRVLEA